MIDRFVVRVLKSIAFLIPVTCCHFRTKLLVYKFLRVWNLPLWVL